ncbi:MAG TPA: sugar phosphate isomerase/epimerase [Flavisolibacter sp.]|jgi:sugar phosphate isomerase/epimerase|nr:sugar phosphate isomerase/epimerase [Flavisolibacter sp.]
MTYQRRKFIKLSAALGAGVVLQSMSTGLLGCNTAKNASGTQGIGPFGLQLYTLRDDLTKDPKGVLKQVSQFGYKQLEGYEGPQGLFWNMTPAAFKSYLDSLGMTMVSSHCDYTKDFERKAEQAASIGMKYLLCPYLGPQKSLDDYKRAADKFNQCGEISKKAGIRFGYHNHDYSFTKQEGVYPQDIMMQQTDKNLVDFEMDIYWVVTAGEDPIKWLEKYPNRFKLFHIKDRKKNTTEKADSVVLGTGIIDFPAIMRAANKQGSNYFIVEQEKYEGTTPLLAAKADAMYMKNLKL